ncbi:MAG: exodeoxyribonuclease VII small subunit [Alphaproteobacteria bacterium]
MAKENSDIAKLTFEAALGELEDIVSKLEAGTVDLEASIALYARGDALRAHCDAKLADATARIEKVVKKGEGIATEPFDAE